MSYTIRELQRETKKILDEAKTAPVRIRRGDEFFEITKLKFNEVYAGDIKQVAEKYISEPVVVSDDQEWVPPVAFNFNSPQSQRIHQRPGKSMDDLYKSGLLQKGIK